MLRFVAMLTLVCCMANTGHAQLLRNLFGGKNVGSNCPGGICPTAGMQSNAQWYNTDGMSAHQHVLQEHGVDTTGWSDQQVQQHQNDYHNQYGNGHPVRGLVNTVVSVPRAGVRAVANYASRSSGNGYGSSGSATRSYGSSGSSATGYGSSGSAATSYGSSGGLTVGKPDPFGQIVTSIGQPVTIVSEYAPAEVSEPQTFGSLRSRRSFKQVALAAAKQKLDLGEWDQDKYDTFRFAIRIPRVAREMEQAIGEQAIEEGMARGLADIDWDKLFALIAKWLPVFLKLFMADSSQPMVINAAPYVSIEKPLPSVFDLVFGDIAA